jgi:hypothetical protein
MFHDVSRNSFDTSRIGLADTRMIRSTLEHCDSSERCETSFPIQVLPGQKVTPRDGDTLVSSSICIKGTHP